MRLEYIDLSAARGLKSIGKAAFSSCEALKQVLLNDGLETIGERCFAKCELDGVSIPGSVKFIQKLAFTENPLTQVRFLGTAENRLHGEHSSGNAKDSCSENEHRQVIGERAFADCKELK